MKRLALLSVAAIMACGGSSVTDAPSVNANGTLTLSGAVTGTYTGTNAVGAYNSSTNQGGVTMSLSQPPASPTFSMAFVFNGAPSTIHYKNTDGASQGAVIVFGSNNAVWLATDASAGSIQGTYDLAVTSLSTIATANGGTSYAVHGTLDATLAAGAATGATGTVTLHMTF